MIARARAVIQALTALALLGAAAEVLLSEDDRRFGVGAVCGLAAELLLLRAIHGRSF